MSLTPIATALFCFVVPQGHKLQSSHKHSLLSEQVKLFAFSPSHLNVKHNLLIFASNFPTCRLNDFKQ